jgi:hypothetical protein
MLDEFLVIEISVFCFRDIVGKFEWEIWFLPLAKIDYSRGSINITLNKNTFLLWCSFFLFCSVATHGFCPSCDSFMRLIHIRCIRIHPNGSCSTLNFCIVHCSSTCYATDVASALQMLDKMSLGKSSMHTHSPSCLMLNIKFWYPSLL